MGERQSGGGVPGRRRVHPGGAASGHRGALDEPGLEAVLAAAMRRDGVEAEGERRAVAAFRAARDADAHKARTRRQDDWRPRRAGRAARTTLAVLLASLTVGGVAFAAIGSSQPSTSPSLRNTSTPRTSHPPTTTPPSRTATTPPDRPTTAADTAAHCRAYDQVAGRGKALDSTAWQRLVSAAGGEAEVAAYCAEHATGMDKQKSEEPDKSGNRRGDHPGKAEGKIK
ncbi:hypothetical protein [Streptomyces sp. KR55]|uniref:hypothetical protein n=1 Tax=Streptomyces sp. KR55 TaxID=3457425 RepID=UPI003FD2C1E4